MEMIKPEFYSFSYFVALQVSDLGLADRILSVKSNHPGSRSRFIYSGGSLHQLPTGLVSVIKKQSLFSKSLFPIFLREPFVKTKTDDADESVYSFFERRLSKEVLYSRTARS